jgi:hypothetical protein
VIKLITKRKKREYYNHIPAKEVKAYIGKETWDSYFKFCFVRNPWDRFISSYFWCNQTEPRASILEFFETAHPFFLKLRGFELYTINGQIAVDKVCRFENLLKEMEAIRKQIGIPEELVLPRAKSRFRKDKRNYRDLIGEEEKEEIAEIFQDEIKIINY